MERRIILQGIVGSRAYGLATPTSDEDRIGTFVTPTAALLGLQPPGETYVTLKPDTTLHEIGKYLKLLLANNPTILETLFLTEYEILSEDAQVLVENRKRFLSKRIYRTYGGYAKQQADRLEKRGSDFGSDLKKRYAKHARHCYRLLQQGRELMETGDLTIKVSNPEELFAIGQLPPEELIPRFNAEFARFDSVVTSLPDFPDQDFANEFLISIRSRHLQVEVV